jgi:hypothetical protein
MGAIGVTAAACGGTVTGGTSADSGPDARNPGSGTVVDASGDAAPSGSDAAPSGSDAAPSGIDAAYGGPGIGVLYGGFSFDAGTREDDANSATSDAGTEEDARHIAVPYGLPPIHE